ncbi:MAG: 1-acyl-sn-glycerol-3-phosphate acyltransferase [Saprospiraceae bacterium]|nr:1-acyl-sn-glycerol-3-phosphate acyltransferase [Saprospiraceae bacterium]
MIYSIVKPCAKIALSVYFRKINISHRERIPKGKPVILALNHPTAFIEPCLVACWLTEPMNFLARGDLFVKSAFIRRLYGWFHIVPVFRIDDTGYSGLKNNYDTFSKCYEALADNKMVMILAEGRTKHEKRLRPLMKGTARIVFGALEKYEGLDVHIVPVGVNYTNPDQFRSDVRIDYGEPIRVQDYAAIYQENQAKAVTALTNELRNRLAERVIHIADPNDDEWVEPLLDLHRHGPAPKVLPAFSEDAAPLFAEKKLVDNLNALPTEQKDSLRAKLKTYLGLLKKAGTTDRGLMDHTSYSLGSATLLGMLWIPALAGYALNWLPLFLGNLFASKKTKNIEFRASVAIFVSMVIYMLYWLICLIVAALVGKWWLIGLVLAMPILGYFALLYRDLDVRWKDCQRAAVLDDEEEKELMRLRGEIVG